MKYKFFPVLVIFLFVTASGFAQEIEFPLSNNPVIKAYVARNTSVQPSGMKRSSSALPLPFQDDFSYPGIYPDQQLWADSDAFVNGTFCDNPITIGVATLDGINKLGNPYDSNYVSTQSVVCDHLTSQPIDLSGYSDADNVYLGFFYQPQGLGDEPEDNDSLVLEFYSFNGTDSGWVHIWVEGGRPDSAFQEVRIKLDNPDYFWGGFQFRFYNYATPNGNRDHWNLDYISLRANESAVQQLFDISFVHPVTSYLSEYTAMPYSHYKEEVSRGNNAVKGSVADTVRSYYIPGGGASAAVVFEITDKDGISQFNQQDAHSSILEFANDAFQVGLPANVFPATIADFADFQVRHMLSTSNSGSDTSYFTQHFYNYYAYDDGSAESATGVHVAYSKYAYKFDVKKADSLLGIQIYFNPWGKNVHQDLFSLCLWSDINVQNNTETLVSQTIDKKPANNDSINGFVDYFFDAPLSVDSGINYIGIVQSSQTEIGLGVDHNTDSHDKMFLNFNNQWYNSTITGSWMMRPIFGKMLTIGVNEVAQAGFEADVFPNPAGDRIYVKGEWPAQTSVIFISNMLGETVRTVPAAAGGVTVINTSDLDAGVYVVRVMSGARVFSAVKKVVVQK